jgi:hypothetical protein
VSCSVKVCEIFSRIVATVVQGAKNHKRKSPILTYFDHGSTPSGAQAQTAASPGLTSGVVEGVSGGEL